MLDVFVYSDFAHTIIFDVDHPLLFTFRLSVVC